MKVLVVGSHVTGSPSMRRYSRLLGEAYQEIGAETRAQHPPNFITRPFRGWSTRKWAGYVDKFILYPFRLFFASRTVDLVHIADHSDAIYLLFVRPSTRTMVTCHDLFAVAAARGELPEWDPRPTGRLYQWLVQLGLRRADRILAISGPSRVEAERITGKPIPLLPNPLDPAFAAALAEVTAAPAPADAVRPPYALIVGGNGFRKRRDLGLEVWRQLNASHPGAELELVVVGPPFDPTFEPVQEPEWARITMLHNVPDAELASLYAGAEMLLTMSRYEGFCWPLIESQAAGVPPLCADEEILRDTAGPGALFVDVTTIASQPASYWQGVRAELAGEPLARAARDNVERFSWARFCAQLRRQSDTVLGRLASDADVTSAAGPALADRRP